MLATRELADQRFGPAPGDEVEESVLTMIVTDGCSLVALRWGRELHFSTCKKTCREQDACPHLAAECEAPTATGFVNHLIVSSEILQGDNVWLELKDGEYVGVDWRTELHRGVTGEGVGTRVAIP